MGPHTPWSARKTAPEVIDPPHALHLRRQTTVGKVKGHVSRRLTRTLMKSVSTNWAVEEYIARRRTAGQLTRLDMTYRALASPGSSYVNRTKRRNVKPTVCAIRRPHSDCRR